MTYTWAILLWLLAVGYPLVVAESLVERPHTHIYVVYVYTDIAHLGNSVRILLEGPLRSSEDVPGSFSLKLDKSGVRINRAPGQGRWGAVQQERRG